MKILVLLHQLVLQNGIMDKVGASNLNAGTGKAWAGQVIESCEFDSLVIISPSVVNENFGFAPPIGSTQKVNIETC